MTVSTTTGGAPLVVGLGGTLRSNSSTERALRYCLESVERQGGRGKLFCGEDLDLPMYAPHQLERTPKALELVGALRDADAVVVGSPGYHGAISGLVKNALDYIEDLREDPRVYLDNTPWGCISCAYGWQAAVGTLGQLRSVGHALRAWPTPLLRPQGLGSCGGRSARRPAAARRARGRTLPAAWRWWASGSFRRGSFTSTSKR